MHIRLIEVTTAVVFAGLVVSLFLTTPSVPNFGAPSLHSESRGHKPIEDFHLLQQPARF